jgi:hypothetical protein
LAAVLKCLDDIAELAEVVRRTISLRTMSVAKSQLAARTDADAGDRLLGVEIRFITGLEAEEVVAQNLLARFDDSETEIAGVVERHAEEPFNIHQAGHVVHHVE